MLSQILSARWKPGRTSSPFHIPPFKIKFLWWFLKCPPGPVRAPASIQILSDSQGSTKDSLSPLDVLGRHYASHYFARSKFFFLTSLLLNPFVSDASPSLCRQDRRVKFLAFLVRVGSGPVSGGHRRAGHRRPGARDWGQSLASSHRGQRTPWAVNTGNTNKTRRRHRAFSQHSETFYHWEDCQWALWPWYEWSSTSLSQLQPHSIVVQLLWAHQRQSCGPALTHTLGRGCWDQDARLFTKHSLHGKFLLLHSHGCQEVSPVILLVPIALRASVSSLARDIRSIPNPVSHFIILSLSRQD